MKKTAIILLSIFAISCYASTQLENVELARINSVLSSIYPLIDAAQKQAKPNTRVMFHYDWLKHDIQQIQAGIAQKINDGQIEPRVIKPLKQSFISQQNSRGDD